MCAISAGAEAVEVSEERIGEVDGSWRSGGAAEDGSGGGAKVGAILVDEMIPGCGEAFGAGGGESEILEMESAQVFFDFVRSGSG